MSTAISPKPLTMVREIKTMKSELKVFYLLEPHYCRIKKFKGWNIPQGYKPK